MKLLKVVFLLVLVPKLFANDTIYFSDIDGKQSHNSKIYYYINTGRAIDFNQINDFYFKKNSGKTLTFGYEECPVWISFTLKNQTENEELVLIEIPNPDIDSILFITKKNNKIIKTIETGEFYDVKTRNVYHRNFVFNLKLQPDSVYKVYIKVVAGGHSLHTPVKISNYKQFIKNNSNFEIFNWLIYGFLTFIILFNLYLFFSINDKINLYYALYVLSATLFFMYYDGYSFHMNPPPIISNLKFLLPTLYIFFLLSFAQILINETGRFKKFNQIAIPIKVFVIFLPALYFFKYPVFLISDIGGVLLMVVTLFLISVISIITSKKGDLPSLLTFPAYSIVLISLIVLQLKEAAIIPSSLFTENIAKFGVSIECLLLTIVILERFRIQQQEAQKVIKDNLTQIELQNKELEIVNSELEKLSIVASETDNSIGIYSTKGKLEWCNQEFEWFYDVNFSDLIKNNKDLIELIVPNDGISKLFDKCKEEKKPVIFETKLRTQNRRELWVQTTLSPYIVRGRVNKIIAIDADISQLKKYERKLENATREAKEADRLKTVFLGNMSHEIRTPLNGIIGFADLLHNDTLPAEKKTKFLKVIKDSGEQLIRIIDDIVDISLIESNQLKVHKETVNLPALFKEVEDFFQIHKKRIKKSHIDLVFELKCDAGQQDIISDGHRVKQVIMNLVKNGFKFTNEGVVKVKCEVVENSIIISIEDTGIGVKPDYKDVIFERFRQQEETLSRTYGGTGVGLSISKGIADKLGGKIWLDTNFGPGARFCFSIPFITEQDRLEEDKVLKSRASKSVKRQKLEKAEILVVEDDDNSFYFLTELLSNYNGNIQRATDGLEAVQLTKSNDFDIILMDINLPKMDGMTAVKKIREFNQSVPIIAQTAYAMVSEKNKIIDAGCNDYITKPIQSRSLLKKLTKYL
jgi:signal transduction histidine kinase